METKEENILNEAVKNELRMSKLYSIFQKRFSEDAELWKQLAEEEKAHAQIILKLIPFLSLDDEILEKFTSISFSALKENNFKIQGIINDFENGLEKTRQDAFRIAIDLENHSFKENYRSFLNTETDSNVLQVFQTLNGEDKKHYNKIIDYTNTNKINI